MSLRWKNILSLSALSAASLFVACKKEYSSDDPLPESYSPSIIISSDNQVVYAINPASGAKNWEFSLPQLPTGFVPTEFSPSPLVYGGRVYITSVNSDTVYKLNSQTGKLVSRMVIKPHAYFTVQATPIADGKLIYLATMNDTLYAFDTTDGAIQWKFGADGPLVSSPTIYNNKLYFASTGGVTLPAGSVYSVDKTNGGDPGAGGSYWQYTPATVPPAFAAKFISSPSVSAPYLYIGSATDSTMYCVYLDADPSAGTVGLERWRYKTKGNIYSSPTALAGKVIFGCTDFRTYCLDTSIRPFATPPVLTPRPYWIDSAHSQIYSSPLAYNQTIYIGSHDYNLYAMKIINGGIAWQFKTNGLVKSSPVAYGGSIFVGSYDKYLYAVDSATGTVKWKFYTAGNISCSPVIDDFSGKQYNSGVSGFTN